MKTLDRTAPFRSPAANLRHSLATTSIVAALLIATAGSPVRTQSATLSPIDIRACSTVYEPVNDQVYQPGIKTPVGIKISYINRSPASIDHVAFRLGDQAAATDVVDHGHFSPGILIEHVFWMGSVPSATCRAA